MQDGRRHDQYGAGPSHHDAYAQDVYAQDAYTHQQPNAFNTTTTNPYDSYDNNYASTSSAGRQPQTSTQGYHDDDASEYGEEPFDLNAIDPALRLRTTRTAHSVIAESIRGEEVRERKRSRLFKIRRRTTRRKGKDGAAPSEPMPTIASSETGDSRPSSLAAASDAAPSAGAGVPYGQGPSDEPKGKKALSRRTIFVNIPLPMSEVDAKGEPKVRYVRNKVRTSKYTLVTFLPRNLFEQFHRVANIYFFVLVILQLFPQFGATTPQIAMLPLVAILGMTAIKDAVEDWRRARLDEEVNTSAATKLGNWKNVNQPTDPRNWFERVFHLGPGE